MKRVAKFEKVTYEQFMKDWYDTFRNPTIRNSIDGAYDVDLPQRATKFSAGYDFYTPIGFELKPGETIKIPTGVRCRINTDWALLLLPRSGLGFKYRVRLENTVGLIDSDYCTSDNEGHIFVKLTNEGNKTMKVERGDAFCQGIFLPYGITEDDCVETTRTGGLGSTDKERK